MSAAFNVFEFNDATNQQSNIFAPKHTVGNVPLKGKVFGNQPDPINNKQGMKPKGLSFRSKVDPNLQSSNINISNKIVEKPTTKLFNLKDSVHATSIHQDENSEVLREKKSQVQSTNSKPPHSTLTTFHCPSTVFSFKEPISLRKEVPEPEKISNDWSEEEYFHKVRPEIVLKSDIEFCNTFLSQRKPVVPFDDECFKSDLKVCPAPNLPLFSYRPDFEVFHDEDLEEPIPSLPSSLD